MGQFFIRFQILALSACLLSVQPATAQSNAVSARNALNLLTSQFGPQAVQWIAEVRAEGGIPQPNDWQVLAFDQRAPSMLYRFWVSGGRPGDGGQDNERYPNDVPVGYFSASQIAVDSVAAFTIAEGEARRVKVAFDSCNYLLRLREFSNEPIWRLELLDAARRLTGKLYISASNGEVLRTIWIYRNALTPSGQSKIIDSFAPGAASAAPDMTSTGPSGSYPDVSLPPMPPGIVTPDVPGRVPGTIDGIHSVPLPPAPGVAVSGNAPSSSGMDPGIPAPPPASSPSAPSAPQSPPISSQEPPTPPAPPAPTPKSPTQIKPSAGDSGRIPPPPIP